MCLVAYPQGEESDGTKGTSARDADYTIAFMACRLVRGPFDRLVDLSPGLDLVHAPLFADPRQGCGKAAFLAGFSPTKRSLPEPLSRSSRG